VIRRLELEQFEGETARLFVECQQGHLHQGARRGPRGGAGCGAHLAGLERTAVGPFRLEQSVSLDVLEALGLPERRERFCRRKRFSDPGRA